MNIFDFVMSFQDRLVFNAYSKKKSCLSQVLMENEGNKHRKKLIQRMSMIAFLSLKYGAIFFLIFIQVKETRCNLRAGNFPNREKWAFHLQTLCKNNFLI